MEYHFLPLLFKIPEPPLFFFIEGMKEATSYGLGA